MKVRPQSNDDDSTRNNQTPSNLIPIEVDGFHAFSDAFALDGQWVIFLSIAGHKDAVKAIRAGLLTNHWINVGDHEVFVLPEDQVRDDRKDLTLAELPTQRYSSKMTLPSRRRSLCPCTADEHSGGGSLFAALTKHSAVPVHAAWKTWLHKRAVQKKELEALTAHGIHAGSRFHWMMTGWPKTFRRRSRKES